LLGNLSDVSAIAPLVTAANYLVDAYIE
jgi:hypothetical protein